MAYSAYESVRPAGQRQTVAWEGSWIELSRALAGAICVST